MKQLKFEHKYAKDIISGAKNTTLRIDDKNIKVGDKVQLVDKTNVNDPQQWQVPGELKVFSASEFVLSKLPSELIKSSEINSLSKEKLYEFLRRFYGESVDEDTVVSLISFEFKPYDQPVPYMLKESLKKNSIIKKVKLYADGGSRGNPGPSAAGFVILDYDDKVIESWNKYLGVTTNNQAEYHAFISGLEWCKQKNIPEVDVFLDSLLVVNQMKGKFKVKNRDLWTLYETAKRLQGAFKSINFTHVPRELNKLADAEVNKALDAVKGEDLLQ